MKLKDEKRLIVMAIEGNRLAFEKLMHYYLKNIYNYLLTHIDNDADIQDIIQEVMLASYQSINDFNQDSSIKTWLFGITRRKIADFYRRLYKDKTVPIVDNIDYVSRTNEIDASFINLSLEEVVSTLPQDERELIHLIFTEQLTYQEIETITGIPVGTIKSKVYSIKNKLKPLLKDDWRN